MSWERTGVLCCSIARADVVQFQRKHTAQFANQVLRAMVFLFVCLLLLYLRCAAQQCALCFLIDENFLTLTRLLRAIGVLYLQRASFDAYPYCPYIYASDVGPLDRDALKNSHGENPAKCGYAKCACHWQLLHRLSE